MEPVCTVSGSVKCTATVESSMLIPQKIKNKDTQFSSVQSLSRVRLFATS